MHTLSCHRRKLFSTIKTANKHKYYFGFNINTKQKRDFVTIILRISYTFRLILVNIMLNAHKSIQVTRNKIVSSYFKWNHHNLNRIKAIENAVGQSEMKSM